MRSWLVPPARWWMRYGPVHAGKRWVWERLINPYLQWLPHRFVARTAFGAKLGGSTTEILQQYVYYFGVWEPNLTAWMRGRLRPGDTFVDVGANIGYFSLLASKLVGPSGRVVAVEPSPRMFPRLRDNLRRNRATNVRPVNAAASDRTERMRLFHGPAHNTGLTSPVPDPRLDREFVAEAHRLDDLLRPQEIRTARLVKIDVEGAEALVVGGMSNLLTDGRADLEIVVEIEPSRLAALGRDASDILEVLRSAGFHAYRIDNDYSWKAYVPPRTLRRPEPLSGPVTWETDVIFSRTRAERL